MAREASAVTRVTVTVADFSGGGAISDDSTFTHTEASRGNLEVLQDKLGCPSSDQSQTFDFLLFVVGPPLKPLPDSRMRKSDETHNIIPRVAEIQINPLSPLVGPGDIELDGSRFVLTEAKERQVRRDAVERLVSRQLLSPDVKDAFSLVLVRKDFKDWLSHTFKAVFQAVLAQKGWSCMETTSVDKITENYTLMLLESMVADFTLGQRFHCNVPVTCLDHLLLKLWTFAHWVYCERFCGYDHRTTPGGHGT
jgi:hypothetical protein